MVGVKAVTLPTIDDGVKGVAFVAAADISSRRGIRGESPNLGDLFFLDRNADRLTEVGADVHLSFKLSGVAVLPRPS